jgi:hypothetical protein
VGAVVTSMRYIMIMAIPAIIINKWKYLDLRFCILTPVIKNRSFLFYPFAGRKKE